MSDFILHWRNARLICQTMSPGSDLVSIHDLALDAFIGQVVTEGWSAWLGFHRINDSAQWQWTDGSPNDYRHWFGGTPDWYGESCAAINYINDGDWIGLSCDVDNRYLLCQKAAT